MMNINKFKHKGWQKLQREFAKSQYELCCQWLGISPYFDEGGDTLFEAIARLQGKLPEKEEEKCITFKK